MHRRAMTLVEILVAVGLLSAVMIPVLLSFTAGSRGLAMSAEDLTVHTAAIELLEQVMASPFDLVPAGTFTNDRIRDGRPFLPATPLRFHVSD
ncbi:type II secretion system protein, partial [Candidatus Ozemobacteraceae bacterium]|nr:type II secretion system protein [Candidatus Ozemobacteraceae bacterium]